MTPNKCPKCGALQITTSWGVIRYECESWNWFEHLNDSKMTQESERCVKRQRDQLASEVTQLHKRLSAIKSARDSDLVAFEAQVSGLEDENAALKERVKRLEEAGDRFCNQADGYMGWASMIEGWHKAKEDKP